jgi:hypothetical protein
MEGMEVGLYYALNFLEVDTLNSRFHWKKGILSVHSDPCRSKSNRAPVLGSYVLHDSGDFGLQLS